MGLTSLLANFIFLLRNILLLTFQDYYDTSKNRFSPSLSKQVGQKFTSPGESTLTSPGEPTLTSAYFMHIESLWLKQFFFSVWGPGCQNEKKSRYEMSDII